VNQNTIVVITSGGSVDMTQWIDRIPGVIEAWYPGQEGGTALAEILFGEYSPSGKLPASFERKWEDNATFHSYYPKPGEKQVEYSEGVFLGYRHFDRDGVKPMFPFGYGLSYTTFAYQNLKVTPGTGNLSQPVSVSFDLKNTGQREGAEVAELYVADGHSRVPRPVKELKGFARVQLKPGESRHVVLTLDQRAFSYYDVQKKDWSADPGSFGILVGSSSDKIELRGTFALVP
jgi:beta-glucosidase